MGLLPMTGTELTGAASGNSTAEASNDAIYIDGSNCFKLRDLGKALDFNVGWSKNKSMMYIEGSRSYPDAD